MAHPVGKITQMSASAVGMRRYGSFAGKPLGTTGSMAVKPVIQGRRR